MCVGAKDRLGFLQLAAQARNSQAHTAPAREFGDIGISLDLAAYRASIAKELDISRSKVTRHKRKLGI